MVIVRIRDEVAELWEAPVPAESNGSATRNFEEMCANPEHKYGKWPEHFTLWQVGHWETNEPEIFPTKQPIRLSEGAAVAERLKQNLANLQSSLPTPIAIQGGE